MDEVFLKVIENANPDKLDIKNKANGDKFIENGNTFGAKHNKHYRKEALTSNQLFFLKLKALLMKRVHDMKRSLKTLVPIMSIEIGCVLAVFGIIQKTFITTTPTEK